MNEFVTIKLGGSNFSTSEKLLDFDYLKELKIILEKQINKGKNFGIVAGGGYLARMYRDEAIKKNAVTESQDLHWIGTTVNVLHAEIIRAIFGGLAESRPFVYEDYYKNKVTKFSKPVVVGGGGRAGHSGDLDSILLANKSGSKTIVSLKNIDYLYSADPKKNSKAHIIEKTTWKDYLNIIGNPKEHEPGGNYPIDPIAARLAQKMGIKFIIMLGSNLFNLEKYLNGENFIGSIIE